MNANDQITQKIKLLPTFGGSFDHGWKTMMKYFLILLLVVIVVGLITAPMNLGSSGAKFDISDWDMDFTDFLNPGFIALGMLAVILGIFALAYSLLIVPIFKYGSDLIFVQAARDDRPQFETLVKGFKENYLHIVLANLLTFALVMLGFIFLFVPGIIVACRLTFVSYLVMDKKLDPILAVEESWRMTKGHGWTIFFMGIVSFFICIAGLVLLFVGIIPATMWIKGSFASLYEAVLIEKNGLPEAA
jgi:hypothetical protein